MKIAIHRTFGNGYFLADCPANVARGCETCRQVNEAVTGFTDQPSVDSWVTARGGVVGDWLLLDLGAAGVK